MKTDRTNGATAARECHGVLLLDKPAGVTSSTAVQRVRRVFDRAKAGHTGTLDPMATGLLPICLGEATKFAGGLLDAVKIYEAVLRLGTATDTGDAEGTVISQGSIADVADRIEETLAEFTGEMQQLPPMYSAIKHRGRPLYRYARAGEEVAREPRRICIEELVLLERAADELTIRVRCSKGTYIRTLAHDIGQRLGCGAHLQALRRTGVGTLRIADTVRWEALEAASEDQRMQWLWPVDILLARLPAVRLDAAGARAVLQGRTTAFPGIASQGGVRLYDLEGNFLGLGRAEGDGRIVPKRMRSAQTLNATCAVT